MTESAENSFNPPRMKTCCCCINLKTGVIIISILWLVYGLYEAISYFIAFGNTNTDSFYSYLSTFTLITGIMFSLTVIGALYGLIVVSFAKITQAYVTIAWSIALRYIINNITEIILFISFKDSYLSYCEDLEEYSEDTCTAAYNNVLLFAIIIDVITIIISIYFATVVAAYRAQQVEKDKNCGSHGA
ncbi:13336_t:CDS:2 [Ambispora leptoticha]|uniref:13336_t:CDS:1 n=1 Tax=Ambispora leptoticha TaxID=144679 RepID=A0A9N9GQC4_9GLOM|nr:13336_t:CDS:2 [Ambispora leptoticha]